MTNFATKCNILILKTLNIFFSDIVQLLSQFPLLAAGFPQNDDFVGFKDGGVVLHLIRRRRDPGRRYRRRRFRPRRRRRNFRFHDAGGVAGAPFAAQGILRQRRGFFSRKRVTYGVRENDVSLLTPPLTGIGREMTSDKSRMGA